MLIDLLLHPVVEGVADDPQSLLLSPGDCWIIGTSPINEWNGKDNQIAGWSDNGWIFIEPFEYMHLTVRQSGNIAAFRGVSWHFPVAVSEPVGGSTIDAEARSAIESILDVLRNSGMVDSPI